MTYKNFRICNAGHVRSEQLLQIYVAHSEHLSIINNQSPAPHFNGGVCLKEMQDAQLLHVCITDRHVNLHISYVSHAFPNDVIKIVSIYIYIVDSPQIFNLVLVDLMSRQRKFRRPDSRARERVLYISLIFATLPVKS